ncbi:hypothetical protein R0G64_32360, partial [Pseudomonas otitidis]|nr:hypothetical protein [Pseudomonas otitidis]
PVESAVTALAMAMALGLPMVRSLANCACTPLAQPSPTYTFSDGNKAEGSEQTSAVMNFSLGLRTSPDYIV